MAKKRGKLKSKITPKKPIKKAKAPKTSKPTGSKPSEAPKPMKDALRELEILAEEKKAEAAIDNVGKKESEIEKKELQIMAEEKKIEKETKKVEAAEKAIKNEVTQKPLTKLTMRDINKGIIGAFIGVVAHFAFIYGRQIAKD